MSLVSVTYITNQQPAKLSQFETKNDQNSLKPIFLRHLRTIGGVSRSRRASRRGWRSASQLKGNELGLLGLGNSTGETLAQKNRQKHASAAERQSSSQ